MNRNDIFLLNSEIEIRRKAALARSEYLRELFGKLGHRLRDAFRGRDARKNGHKIDNRVGGATA